MVCTKIAKYSILINGCYNFIDLLYGGIFMTFKFYDIDGDEQNISESELFQSIVADVKDFNDRRRLSNVEDEFVFNLDSKITKYLFLCASMRVILNEKNLDAVLNYHWQMAQYFYSNPKYAGFMSHSFVLPLLLDAKWGHKHLPHFRNVLLLLNKKDRVEKLARDIEIAKRDHGFYNFTLPGITKLIESIVFLKHYVIPNSGERLKNISDFKRALIKRETRKLLKHVVKTKSFDIVIQYLLNNNSLSPDENLGLKVEGNSKLLNENTDTLNHFSVLSKLLTSIFGLRFISLALLGRSLWFGWILSGRWSIKENLTRSLYSS